MVTEVLEEVVNHIKFNLSSLARVRELQQRVRCRARAADPQITEVAGCDLQQTPSQLL
jgi:hypothetical protein